MAGVVGITRSRADLPGIDAQGRRCFAVGRPWTGAIGRVGARWSLLGQSLLEYSLRGAQRIKTDDVALLAHPPRMAVAVVAVLLALGRLIDVSSGGATAMAVRGQAVGQVGRRILRDRDLKLQLRQRVVLILRLFVGEHPLRLAGLHPAFDPSI